MRFLKSCDLGTFFFNLLIELFCGYLVLLDLITLVSAHLEKLAFGCICVLLYQFSELLVLILQLIGLHKNFFDIMQHERNKLLMFLHEFNNVLHERHAVMKIGKLLVFVLMLACEVEGERSVICKLDEATT